MMIFWKKNCNRLHDIKKDSIFVSGAYNERLQRKPRTCFATCYMKKINSFILPVAEMIRFQALHLICSIPHSRLSALLLLQTIKIIQ